MSEGINGIEVSFVLSTADQDDIDDDVDWFLEEAGLPKRPRGYHWFQQGPPDLWERVLLLSEPLGESPAARDHLKAVSAALAEIYAQAH